MPVSGTTTFSTTRDELITDALQAMGVLQDGAAATANDIALAQRSLNMLIKAMAASGIPIWAIQTIAIPLTSGVPFYSVGATPASVVTNRPIRIYEAYLLDSNGNSTPMTQISKQEYDFLSYKNTPGLPNQYYYDPTLDRGTIYTYPVINQTGYTMTIAVQRQLYDMTTGAQTFDFPQEAYLMLKWCLARDLITAFSVPSAIKTEIKENADRWENKFWDFSVEEASVFIEPQIIGEGYGSW